MSLSGILARKGAAITFTKADRTTGFDAATDTPPEPVTPTTVSGRAMGVGGPEDRVPGTSVEAARVTLVFQPSTAGEVPEDGATCSWAGSSWSVASVDPVAMNGDAMGAFVVLER